MRSRRILILDDDADYRKLIIAHLDDVFDNTDLVEYDPLDMGIPGTSFNWSDYDVLILDYDLRHDEANGLDILHANRDNPDFPITIMLTGAGSEEVAVTALKAGVCDYFRKDKVKKEQLRDAVRNAFLKRRMSRERTYTMEEAHKAAKAEAMKLIAAFKSKYEGVHKSEMEKLLAEKTSLEKELKESKKIFEQLSSMMHVGEQERHIPTRRSQESTPGRANIRIPSDDSLRKKEWALEPVEKAKQQQENVEADLQKVKWKIQQQDFSKKNMLDDINSFKKQTEQEHFVLSRSTSEKSSRARSIAAESARQKQERNREEQGLLDEVSSQLDKDKF